MSIVPINKLLSKEAARVYYNLNSGCRYIDGKKIIKSLGITVSEFDRAVDELLKQDLVDVNITIRKKRSNE